ncbi:hypothetical protein S40288_00415 [Stachybotrys chartarum IBT 40288]|nr:hypothetical protein S40288_00415 [Stachybotrys chartarum IBT 40288]
MAFHTTAAAASSIGLRIAAYIALRLIPAHFHLVTFALFATYVPSFLSALFAQPDLKVFSDDVDIAVKETPAEEVVTPLVVDDELASPAEAEAFTQELVVKERVVVAETYPSPWQVLLFGVPSRKRPGLSALSFLINLVLVGFAADALYRATLFEPATELSFARLGYVSHSEANFIIREPDQSKMPVTLELHMKDPRTPIDNHFWQHVGDIQRTSNETDYTGTISIPLTHPRQHLYEWRTSNNHSGEFLAPPKPGQMPEYNNGKFTFLSTSCILPRFPYSPTEHPLAVPGMRHLARKLPSLGAQFMLFLGDFIYVDVPRRFGQSTEEYSKQYRQVYASPDWASVGQNLSWLHVLDDHEIANDWSSNDTGVYQAAIEPWNIYHAAVNPAPATVAGAYGDRRRGATWFEFVQGPASFFMLDTRSHRSSNTIALDSDTKTMLGPDQLEDFLAWLVRPEPHGVRWKIVASSVPLTKNWPVNVQDTWGGFLSERKQVLEAMWDAAAKGYGVVTLSGDRHEFAATKFPPPAGNRWFDNSTVWEFSTSPLNQFASPIPTYKQTDDEDVMMKYIPSGTSKFAAITIESIGEESTLHFRVYINGEEAWSTLLVAPHVVQAVVPKNSIWDRLKFA